MRWRIYIRHHLKLGRSVALNLILSCLRRLLVPIALPLLYFLYVLLRLLLYAVLNITFIASEALLDFYLEGWLIIRLQISVGGRILTTTLLDLLYHMIQFADRLLLVQFLVDIFDSASLT